MSPPSGEDKSFWGSFVKAYYFAATEIHSFSICYPGVQAPPIRSWREQRRPLPFFPPQPQGEELWEGEEEAPAGFCHSLTYLQAHAGRSGHSTPARTGAHMRAHIIHLGGLDSSPHPHPRGPGAGGDAEYQDPRGHGGGPEPLQRLHLADLRAHGLRECPAGSEGVCE